jgi:hypothetical protein
VWRELVFRLLLVREVVAPQIVVVRDRIRASTARIELVSRE